MKITSLTPNGIDELVQGNSAIVQIVDRAFVDREEMKFIKTSISDGYSKIQKCFFNQTHFPAASQPLFSIVELKLKINEKNRKKLEEKDKKSPVLLVDSDSFQIVYSGINKIIGNPLDYRQFLKNNKINSRGCSEIPLPESDDSQNELTSAIQQEKNTLAKKQNGKSRSSNLKNEKERKGAIEKIKKEERRSIKPQVRHHASQFQPIKELFLGIQNFKLLVRVLFVWPIKNITNKKGNQSQLLNIEFGDKSGTIMTTCFGDLACRYSNLAHDTVYVISGASVIENNFRNVQELKLTFNDSTKFNQVESEDVPSIDYFCQSVKQLIEMDKGTSCSVIGIVKEGELNQFISKQGNPVKKKILYLYDVQTKVEAQLVLFNDKTTQNFFTGVYAMKGIQIDEYQGVKQFKGSLVFLARPLKNHPLEKYLNEIDETEFVNISSGEKIKKCSIRSFTELKEKCQELQQKQNIWSQIFCFFKTIKYGQNTKLSYLSCPKCRKKVTQTDQSKCINCNELYVKAKNRYLLRVNLIDDHEGIWASAYDNEGEMILAKESEQAFSADQLIELNQDLLGQRLKELKYKKLKLKIVSYLQEYQGENRLKHKVVKVIPVDYHEENKGLLLHVKSILKKM